MEKRVFFCVGGDKRNMYVCRELLGLGMVYSCGIAVQEGVCSVTAPEDMPVQADVLVLPMLNEGLELDLAGEKVSLDRLAAKVKAGGIVLGGRLRPEHKKYFADIGLDTDDYFSRESLVLKNCIPTAEGALQLALSETTGTVFGSNVLILGFGRTAKCCARLFKAAGASCTVAARRPEALAAAATEGLGTFGLAELKSRAGKYDIMINTVPALLLTADVLSCVKRECLIIDLASMPGGTDFGAAQMLSLNAIHALALPGKTAPSAAGRYIAETIEEILNERG